MGQWTLMLSLAQLRVVVIWVAGAAASCSLSFQRTAIRIVADTSGDDAGGRQRATGPC
jgi:hypothetical protein